MNQETITDNQDLLGAKNEFGRDIKVYDDGFGPLWAYQESLGIVGIVRANSEDDAYSCVLDEILTPVPLEDIKKTPEDYYVCERNYHCEAPKNYEEARCLCSLAENAHHRTCWKCQMGRKVFPQHDPEACGCVEPIVLEPVSLTLAECCEYQPNSGGSSGIVQTDLNGSMLTQLTPERIKEWKLTLKIEEAE